MLIASSESVVAGTESAASMESTESTGSAKNPKNTASIIEEARQRGVELILKKQKQLLKKDWSQIPASKQVHLYKGSLESGPALAILDFGCKKGILEEVKSLSSEVHLYPGNLSSIEKLKKRKKDSLKALFLSNGPGDPSYVSTEMIDGIKALMGKWPMMGVCFGHQVLGRALGAKTKRLKFGHRGSNHPIQDKLLSRIYMTSQNHSYVVDADSLPSSVERTHWNLNDKSLAGFFCREKACFGVQFHPESCPGPRDATPLFKYFFKEVVFCGLDLE